MSYPQNMLHWCTPPGNTLRSLTLSKSKNLSSAKSTPEPNDRSHPIRGCPGDRSPRIYLLFFNPPMAEAKTFTDDSDSSYWCHDAPHLILRLWVLIGFSFCSSKRGVIDLKNLGK